MLADQRPNHLRMWFVPAVVGLLLVFALELFLSVRLESQTFDEAAHLYAGYSYWLHSDFGVNPEHPPFVKLVASLPLLLSRPPYPLPLDIHFRGSSGVGGVMLLTPPGSYVLLAHARIAVSTFAFVLALLVAIASYEMFGQWAALFALALLVFDPLLVAHGALLGTDVGATCCFFAAIYTFYRYIKRPSPAKLAICGVAVGLALAAKHSAIFIFPLLLLLSATEVVLFRTSTDKDSNNSFPDRNRTQRALYLGGSWLAIAAIAIVILWAFYGFRYQARPHGKQIVPPTSVYLRDLHSPAASHLISFSERHHLLPEAYLYGLTDVAILNQNGRVMYLFGKLYPEGRWYYFPIAFFIKSTLGFLLLLVLIPFARGIWGRESRRETLFLAIPPVFFFAIAMTSRLDIGIRHIMPAIPFLFVLAAAGAVSLAHQSRRWCYAVSMLLAIHVASSLYAFPDYLPYSNEIFGGPSKTYRALGDSNVGWGGGLKQLRAYLDAHHITQCWFAYSALPDPASFGIPCKELPSFFSMLSGRGQQPIPEQIEGPVFITAEEVTIPFWGSPEMNPYQEFVSRQPSHVIAGQVLQFDGTFPVIKVASTSRFILSAALLNQGKVNQAVAQAQAAVALDPNSLYAHEALASAYAAQHHTDDATHEYQAAVRLYMAVDPQFTKNNVAPPKNPLPPSHP